MKHFKQKNKGFTLVETLISILILTTAVVAFMELIANNWFIARYANNEITANYLTQEVFDSIRNYRDTKMFLNNVPSSPNTSRIAFYGSYGADQIKWNTNPKSHCYTTGGCEFDVTKFPSTYPSQCSAQGCTQTLYYDPSPTTGGFYTYTPNARTIPTTFIRQINMSINEWQYDELNITVKLTWKNGTQTKSRSTYYTLMDWQK